MNKVSVIIPTKNREDLLSKVLPTYLSQKELGEVIVINDGSTDRTAKYLYNLSKKDERLVVVELSDSMGAPHCRNLGVSRARYPYIYFGEDDLYLKPDTFTTLISHLKKNKADIISGRRVSMRSGESEKHAYDRANTDSGNLVDKVLITTNCQLQTNEDIQSDLLDASMLIKKEILNTVPYDSKYKKNAYREETDFQLSCREQGYTLIYCPHVVTFHLPKENKVGGNHGSNTILYEIEVIKNNYYFFRKHQGYLKDNFHLSFLKHMVSFIYYRICYRNIFPFVRNALKRMST